jgi:hypothetical protein
MSILDCHKIIPSSPFDLKEAFGKFTATGTETSNDLDTVAGQEFPMDSFGL